MQTTLHSEHRHNQPRYAILFHSADCDNVLSSIHLRIHGGPLTDCQCGNMFHHMLLSSVLSMQKAADCTVVMSCSITLTVPSCILHLNLQEEARNLRAQLAETAAVSADLPSGEDNGMLAAVRDENLHLRQQLLSLAADNSKLAVSLAEASVAGQYLRTVKPNDDGSLGNEQQHAGVLKTMQLLARQLTAIKSTTLDADQLSTAQQDKIRACSEQQLKLAAQLQILAAENEQLKADILSAMLQKHQPSDADGSAGSPATALLQLQHEKLSLQLELTQQSGVIRQLRARVNELQAGMLSQLVPLELEAKYKALLQVGTKACAGEE